MKSPSQTTFSHGRPALIAATVAILFGASTALAQAGGAAGATSSGSSQKNPSSTSTSDTSQTDSSQSGHKSQSGTSSNAAQGSTYHSGTASADADATKEINAQSGATSTTAGAATGRETTSSSNKLGWMDRRFVTKAADGGQAELAVAKLAAEKASNAEVKSFAQKLVDDHSKVNDELKGIAGQKNVKLDDDNDHDRAYKRLSKKSGAEFDREFVEHMIDEHEKDVKMFEKAAKDAKDSDVRSFAAKHVDHLREHLRQAESLRASTMPTGRTDDNSGRASTSGSASSDYNSSSTSGRSSGQDATSSSTSSSSDRGSTSTSSSSDDSTNSSTTPKRDGSR
jgi:putative membrane protein